jgi:sugar lactone lactonase YvrE
MRKFYFIYCAVIITVVCFAKNSFALTPRFTHVKPVHAAKPAIKAIRPVVKPFAVPTPPLAAPNITYAGGTQTYATGNAITPLLPTNTGGAVPAIAYGQVTTFAGSGAAGNANGVGTVASFNLPYGVAVDPTGNVYVADYRNNQIRKITPAGVVTTFPTATNFSAPTAVTVDATGNVYLVEGYTKIRKVTTVGAVNILAGGDFLGNINGMGPAARFHNPSGLAVDVTGNVYVADQGNDLIRKITPEGIVSTFAGSGVHGSTDGTSTAASFSAPTGIAVDAAGNVYVVDTGPGTLNNKLRKITPTGVVSTLPGSFIAPSGVAVDAIGNIYVVDAGNRILKITPAGVVSTLAGDFYSGNTNGIGTAARFRIPYAVAVDAANNVYVADQGNNLIRKISTFGYSISPALPIGLSFDGTTGKISGTPLEARAATTYTVTAYNAAGSSSATINLTVTTPPSNSNLVALGIGYGELSPVFATGTLNYNVTVPHATEYFAVTPTAANPKAIIKVAGVTVPPGTSFADLPLAPGANSIAVAVTAQDGSNTRTYNIKVTRQSDNPRLAGLSLSKGTLSPTFAAATLTYAATVAESAITVTPTAENTRATIKVNGIAVATGKSSQSIQLALGNNAITVVGTSEDGSKTRTYTVIVNRVYSNIPPNIAYESGTYSYKPGKAITVLAPTNTGGAVPATIYGQVTKFVGSIVPGNADGPSATGVDPAGNVYVVVFNRIHKITPTGVVSTFAGNGTIGNTDGTGTAASFGFPRGLAVDAVGNVYITDTNNHLVRKITPAGVVSTLAGNGTLGNADGTGTAATLFAPWGIATDAAGNVFVGSGNRLRKITPAGLVTTFTSTGWRSINDSGTAVDFGSIQGITVDAMGNLYLVDTDHNRIRKVSPAGVVSIFAGSGARGYTEGNGAAARFYLPNAVAVDAAGNVYVSDRGNNAIRKITPAGMVSTLASGAAVFIVPFGVATDVNGSVYVSDLFANLIRKISTTGYSISPALPAGLVFDATTGTISGTPTAISPVSTYSVTAYNTYGSSTTTVKIGVSNLSDNTRLAGLYMIDAALSPAFAAKTYLYTATSYESNTYVIPTAENPRATIKVNGTPVFSESYSQSIPLAVGNNTISVVVTSEDELNTRTYTINVTRIKSDFFAVAPSAKRTTTNVAGNQVWLNILSLHLI